MTRYPVDWPENCPPPEAASGTVYRVCRSNPPAPEDFKSHAELGKQSKSSECMRRGLSVFRDGAEARHLTRIFPKLGSLVFRGELVPQHGKIKPTPTRDRPTHTTWWSYPSVDHAQPFCMDSET